MKVTDKMIEAARAVPRCDRVECDECLTDALEAVLKELTAEDLMDMLHDHGVSSDEYQNYLSARWAEDQRKDAGL